MKKRTDEGILERKKRLEHSEIIKTDSLKKLIDLFCQQAKLDEELRNMKIWFESTNTKDKFNKLLKLLEKDKCFLSEKEARAIFKVEESENNPFFTLQDYSGSIEGLSRAYAEAAAHWNDYIRHRFEREGLLAEGFTKNKIDLERKGFIEL